MRLPATIAALTLLACSSTGPGQRLSLSFSTPPQSSTTTVGSDVLVITKAEIILRKVELEGEDNDCAQGPSEGECEEFEAGPFRLELPLNSVDAVVSVTVPPGSYEEVEFEIHKVNESDATFATANPDFVGKSIRVEGTFNGQPFVFESDLDVEQEVELEPPLVVAEQTSTNLTIRVDLGSWFRTAAGALIDPGTATVGGINEALVKENIKRSFRAFEDEDEDGEEDAD